jgi:hypothetical protein
MANKDELLMRKQAGPKEGSLAWYRAEWGHVSPYPAMTEALAQLSYENKQLRSRLGAVEAMLLSQILGVVRIGGSDHLLECRKREDRKLPCTCGSEPEQKKGGK